MEYDPMDNCKTFTIEHNYLVESHSEGVSVDRFYTDSYRDAQSAFARMCNEGRGNVVTIYDGRKYEYVAKFTAGTKRHKLTRELIELIFNPAGA